MLYKRNCRIFGSSYPQGYLQVIHKNSIADLLVYWFAGNFIHIIHIVYPHCLFVFHVKQCWKSKEKEEKRDVVQVAQSLKSFQSLFCKLNC